MVLAEVKTFYVFLFQDLTLMRVRFLVERRVCGQSISTMKIS
jgi:hypothetical protein